MTTPASAVTNQPAPSHGLTGTHRVRVVRPAFREAARLFPRVQDWFEIKAHALKLRYWPAPPGTLVHGKVLDLDCEWIKALKGLQVGELRIDDEIAGHRNLRLIFFVGDPAVRKPLPLIWILAVLNKKRQEFTSEEIDVFRGRRTLVEQRYYRFKEFE